MPATTIDRTHYDALVQDSGSGRDGSPWDKDDIKDLLDDIDAIFTGANGLTLNQGGGDSFILTLESSDVTHGLAGAPSTNAYGSFVKTNATTGGLQLTGWQETGLDHSTLFLCANQKDAAQTTKAVGNQGVIRLRAQVNGGSVGANGNMFSLDNNGATQFFLDADGDSHQNVGTAWTNFDAFNDPGLLTALSVAVSQPGDPLRNGFYEFLEIHRAALERARLVTFNDDGHHFVNMSRLTMLLVGAVRQIAADVQRLREPWYRRLWRRLTGARLLLPA